MNAIAFTGNLKFFIMLLTPHTLVGASIGASTNNVSLIIILAFLSHFILDAIPHFDWGTWHNYDSNFKLEKKDYILLVTDVSTAGILLFWVWTKWDYNIYIVLGAFSAVLVDLIDNVPFWKRWMRQTSFGRFIHKIHTFVHYKIKPKYWYWGVITQVLIIGGCLCFLID